ncbi:phage terminase large subunit [Acetobacter orientalis]|uniref:phage terminase large subunit n=1 Tax=Acetobacter orientalis TaxID=146474 RepID=UPI0020A5AA75|nr:phage terminase large subunit [Acetobacter orientalis]MCP1222421.1 phage terminase large subunit [Acetobacter orientalis]
MKNLQPLHRQASQTAQNELATRKQARTSLLGFTHYTMPDYRCGPHHALLCQKLEAVAQGHITRLMVFMPPRHGKSELVSRRFPAWYLGQHPTRQVIAASYGATLAQDFGRSVRNLVTTQPFQALFPGVKLAPDSAAKDVWHTAQGGSYTAAGVGGGLTGKGAHLAIIDDPIKDRQEAESPARRLAVWAWYRAVLRTRLMPGGAIVLVMTRWSPDDLAGRLLADMQNATGEAWHTLSLPAVAEAPPSPQLSSPSAQPLNVPNGPAIPATNFVPSSPATSQQHSLQPHGQGDQAPLPSLLSDPLGRAPGTPLWPAAFSAQELERIRLAVGPREWSALYQQHPVPAEGTLFKTALINVQDALPASQHTVRRWDLAATTRSTADWTVGVKMARLPDGRFAVLDIARLRADPAQVEAALLATAAQDGPQTGIILPQDPGQAGVAQARYLTGRLAGYKVHTVRESGSKATRASPFASQVNAGNVVLLRAPWVPAFLEELAAFPTATHDDQVDAAAGAFTALAETAPLPRFGPAFLARI